MNKRYAEFYTISNKVKMFRQENNLSQKEFAKRCKITVNSLSRLENANGPVSYNLLKKVSAGMSKKLQIDFID